MNKAKRRGESDVLRATAGNGALLQRRELAT